MPPPRGVRRRRRVMKLEEIDGKLVMPRTLNTKHHSDLGRKPKVYKEVSVCAFARRNMRDFSFHQGRNDEWARGTQFTGRWITMGAPNDCGGSRKVPTMSQVLSSIECICFRKTSGSNKGVPDLLSCTERLRLPPLSFLKTQQSIGDAKNYWILHWESLFLSTKAHENV